MALKKELVVALVQFSDNVNTFWEVWKLLYLTSGIEAVLKWDPVKAPGRVRSHVREG